MPLLRCSALPTWNTRYQGWDAYVTVTKKRYVGDGAWVLNVATPDAHASDHTDGTDQIADVIAAGASGLISGADKTKLNGVEALADVTDPTNVNAAGATMNADADVKANSYVVDEDNMASDLDTKVPTQQSVKKYVDDNQTLIRDADQDTKVQTEEAADEDIVRIDAGGVEVGVLRSSGILDWPLQSACHAHRTGGQNIGTGSWTKVNLTVERFDIQGEFDNAVNYRFTATEAGVYLISTMCYYASTAANKSYYAAAYINGAFASAHLTQAAYATEIDTGSTVVRQLSAGDYVELKTYHNTGATRAVSGPLTYLCVAKVG